MTVADEAQILTIGVIPSARRRGVGQAMLDELLAEAARRGAVAVFLEVRVDNDAAQQLYRRNGFTDLRIRRGYYDNGRADALEMRRDAS
jgi:ribosomal-protein-alanine acetyltransferase